MKPWAGDEGGLEARQLFAVLTPTVHLLSPKVAGKRPSKHRYFLGSTGSPRVKWGTLNGWIPGVLTESKTGSVLLKV